MIRRVVSISEPSRLRTKDNALLVLRGGGEIVRVPLEDLGLLVLDGPGIDLTLTLLSALATSDVAVVVCGNNHLPVAYQLPYPGHSLHPKILRGQIQATVPTKKRLWACLIRAKLRNAGAVCRQVTGKDAGLADMAKGVASGDEGNLEAQAAVAAFRALFGNEFRRDTDGDGLNARLNYGYAILRAAVARALAGAGLDLALGIWHHNRADAYALADDLMEPLRPLVDRKVASLPDPEPELELDAATKRELVQVLGESVKWVGKTTPLLVALESYAAGFRDALLAGKKDFPCPNL